MKPLELVTEPSPASRGWVWNGRSYRQYVDGKHVASMPFRGAPRFTDAELAAEYWAASSAFNKTNFNELSSGDEFSDERWDSVTIPLNTLYRFATLPHYDEVTE